MKNDVVTKLNPIKNVVFDLGGVLIAWKPDEIITSVFDNTDLQTLIKREIFQHPDWLEIAIAEVGKDGTTEFSNLRRRFHPARRFRIEISKFLQFSILNAYRNTR